MTEQSMMNAVLQLIDTNREADKQARDGISQHLDDLERRLTRKLEELCRALHAHEENEETAAVHCREAVMSAIATAKTEAITESTKPSPYQVAGKGLYRGIRDIVSLVALGAGIALTITSLVGG